jgi:hypothetical protein
MGANVFRLPQTQHDSVRMSVQVKGSPFDLEELDQGWVKPTGDSSPGAEVAVAYVEIRIGKPVA